MVKRALATLGIPSLLEPVGLDRRDSRRPDGITVFPYHQGKSLTWDGTCVDTYCDSSIVDCSINPGSAAAAAEEIKRVRYASLTDRYIFEPVAVETSGVVGPSTVKFLSGLGKRLSVLTGNKKESTWLFQRISMAVVRGNSASITATGCLVT